MCACLCRLVFNSTSTQHIKKLLYGAAAYVELSVLKMILKKINPVLDLSTIPQLCYKGSYLCELPASEIQMIRRIG